MLYYSISLTVTVLLDSIGLFQGIRFHMLALFCHNTLPCLLYFYYAGKSDPGLLSD